MTTMDAFLSLPGAPAGAAAAPPPRPAAPVPPARRLPWLRAVRALLDNPLTALAEPAFVEPILPPAPVTGMMLVSDPLAIEHVLIGNAENYRKSAEQRRVLEPALGPGLITAEGAAWRSARTLVAPAFTPRAVAARAEQVAACAGNWARRWRTTGPHGLDMAAELQRLAFDIVSQTLFGGALDHERDETRAAITRYLDTIGRLDLATLLRLPPALSLPARLKARPARRALRRVVAEATFARLAHGAGAEPDLLDRLIAGATDGRASDDPDLDAIGDGILTFLIAGHETTANALAWTLYLLALHPESLEQVRDELAAVTGWAPLRSEEFDAVPVLRAVVSEALRLYPPVPFIGRDAIGDDMLDEVPVPAGSRVMISPWVVHRHRRLWDDPDLFRPGRFLGKAARKVPRGAFLPFGLGPRICIGQGFAHQEILIVLSVLLPQFRFELLRPEAVFPEARITLRPRGGLPMRLHPRLRE